MDKVCKAKVLFVIVEKEESKKIVRMINKYPVNHMVSISSTGTASSSLMEYFGLVNNKREIIMAIIPEIFEGNILYDLCIKFKMNEPGKGMAFTVRLVSGSKCLINHESKKIPKEEIYMKEDKKYELIISIVSEGHGSLCMDAAKKAGAGGGTLINGIGLGSKEATKLLGITIEPEKDVVLILAESSQKRKIMEEINEAIGLSTEGAGISFSIPVENTIGLTDKINFTKVENEK